MTPLRAYAGLGARILAHRLGSKRPFKITWALTDRCDCRCRGCLIWQKPKGREPTPDEIGRVLADTPSLRWVNLTGGEPFLRDDLPQIARAIRDARPDVALVDLPTTGQRTERIVADVEAMVAVGLPRLYVTVSLEGPPALHDAARGREGAFVRMVETYAALRAVDGVRVYLGLTLTAENADRVEDALEAVRAHLPPGAGDVGWRDLHLNVFTTSGHYYANEGADVRAPAALGRAVTKARRAREGSLEPTDRIESTYLRLLPKYLKTGRSPLPCKSLRASVFVAANGDLYPCTVWDRPLGNVYETPLPELLATAHAERTRKEIARDRCPGCWSPCEANPTIVSQGLP